MRHHRPAAVAALAAVLGVTSCAPRSANRSAANDPYVKAALAYQDGDRDRAASLVQNALEKDPDHIMARLLLGNIHRDKAEYAAAAEHYQRVSELDPYSYKGHYLLGLMYHLLGKLQEATVSYLQSLKLEPDDVRSNMN